MSTELPFDGYSELIRAPLEKQDPSSFKRIRRIFLDLPPNQPQPFRILLRRLTGKVLREDEARKRWKEILAHKQELEGVLGRRVGIQAAAVDLFDLPGDAHDQFNAGEPTYRSLAPARNARDSFQLGGGRLTDGYHVEKLREEMTRARRYRHSLSAILVDVEDVGAADMGLCRRLGERILAAVVRIIQSTVRTVDFVARYSEQRFLVILPNTNHREASELAARLCGNIRSRTARMKGLESRRLAVGSSVRQLCDEESSVEFLRRIESELEQEKEARRAASHAEGGA